MPACTRSLIIVGILLGASGLAFAEGGLPCFEVGQ